MTSQEKAQAMKLFLTNVDCTSVTKSDSDEYTFSYTPGSNEGGYMVIDRHEYRCMSSTPADYVKAVQFFLTLV
jgi:hypothetical protein